MDEKRVSLKKIPEDFLEIKKKKKEGKKLQCQGQKREEGTETFCESERASLGERRREKKGTLLCEWKIA